MNPHPYLNISKPSGELYNKEDVSLSWYLLKNVQDPRKFKVKCEIRAMQNLGETIGPPFEAFVTITSESSYSQLCVITLIYSAFITLRDNI